MARNTKSATLPSNLRTRPPPAEDSNETFFTKLKKKLKFKKGKYNVDLNTGECENVSAVSFKKRSSSELLDTDQPLKHGVGRSSERSSRSESPKSNKATTRSQSERFIPGQLATRPTHERKHSNPTYNDPRYPQMTSGEFFRSTKTKADIKNSKSDTVSKGNEYSVMKFEKEDVIVNRPLKLDTDKSVSNECVVQDDSAIDLDNFDIEVPHPKHMKSDFSYTFEQDYKHGQDIREEVFVLNSSETVLGKSTVEKITPTSNHSEGSFEFDPHYESVHDVKKKIKEHYKGAGTNISVASLSQSTDSLDDPRYQSIKEVKKKVEDSLTDTRKPLKTYDVSKSIESLDEPGYESLNDVKKRISENFSDNSALKLQNDLLPLVTSNVEDKDVCNLNDSAVSFSMVNESMSHVQTGCDDAGQADLTQSSMSRDSGFDTKVDRSPENPDCLYSTVNKKPANEEAKLSNKATTDRLPAEPVKTQTEGEPKTLEEAESLVPADQIGEMTEYDSDVELVLDPGYAECADAIKGFPPYHAFSDGSESKISSCTSLDLSAEDFPPEPGYAECADAIKSGSIKKISVSHEKLITDDTGVMEDVKLRLESKSEIYANPQILFKKRSKLIERASGELSPSGTCSDNDMVGSLESLNSNSALTLTAEREPDPKKGEEPVQSSPEAPPLPARNYSLYLDSDEAAQIVPDDDKLSGSDDAFESESHLTESVRSVSEKVESLSNCLLEQEITRTHSETFEVHADSQFSEESMNCVEVLDNASFSNETVGSKDNSESDLKNDNYMNDSSNVRSEKAAIDDNLINVEMDTGLNVCETKGCIKTENINSQTAELKPTSGDECVHITVSDKQGNTKVLTVINKQASLQHGSKIRKQDVVTNMTSFETDNKDEIQSESVSTENSVDKADSAKDVAYKEDIENENVHSVWSIDTGKENNKAYQENIDRKIDTSAATNHTLSYTDIIIDPSRPSTNYHAIDYSISHISHSIDNPVTDSHVKTGLVQDSLLEDVKLPESNIDTRNVPDNNIKTVNIPESAEGTDRTCNTQSEVITVNRGGSLEVVHPVKMYSISWDSDEEFQGTEHLPRLEIVESDIENVFDSSDNSAKLMNESGENEKIECLKSCVHDKVDSINLVKEDCVSVDKEIANKVSVQTSEHFDDVDSGHVPNDQLELCAGISEVSYEDNIEINQSNQSQIKRHTGDHSKEHLPDSAEKVESQTVTMCNSIEQQVDKSVNNVEPQIQVSKSGLPVLSSDLDPALYDDSEPTHMSLSELMTLSSVSDSALLVSNHSAKMQNDITQDTLQKQSVIPNSKSSEGLPLSQVTTPQRPHSYNSGQSKNRNSSSSQSGQSNATSPDDDTLPGFRFAERSLSDIDDTPPAIPPRARIKKMPHQRRHSATQDFMESMRQLKDCGWYWGPLSWEEAEQKLSNKPEGTFLVRDSSDERYILSLSFKNQGRVHHTRIEHHRGHFSFWSQPDSHGKSTIKEFIEQCVNNSENGRFLYFIRPSGPGSPPMPIHLLYPVSRFIQMQSLQHMCRFRILQMVRRDHIDDLPVPTRIKQYLKEAQYYVEYLDD